MAYKEKVQDEIKEEKLKDLWQEITESYEQGGAEQIKSTLNTRVQNQKSGYEEILKKLENML